MTRTLEDMAGDDILDSRDILERLEELRDAAGEDPNEFGCTSCLEGSSPHATYPSLDLECGDELVALEAIDSEGSDNFADWAHGEALIRDSYFVIYAEELANDIGAVDSDAGWPASYIDWDRAADALQMDYSSIEINGITYWAR